MNENNIPHRGAEVFDFLITNMVTHRKIRYKVVVLDFLSDFINLVGYTARATTYMHSKPKTRGGWLGIIVFLRGGITPRVIYHEAFHAAYSMAKYTKSVSKTPITRAAFEEWVAEFVEVIIGQCMERVWGERPLLKMTTDDGEVKP